MVNHGEFNSTDKRKDTAGQNPVWFVPEDMTKRDIWGHASEVAKEGVESNPRPSIESRFIISHVNINSVTALYRLQELSQFVEINNVDIVALTKTKLDDTVHPDLYRLPSFHSTTNHRNRHGGGTARGVTTM